jgi:phosphoglycerate kinase
MLEQAKNLISENKINLPVDVVIAEKIDANANVKTVTVNNISEGWAGCDIGPETCKNYSEIITMILLRSVILTLLLLMLTL